MAANTLERLMRWYTSQCNGDWEHSWGIQVGTLDNPGWTITINLEDTQLVRQSFARQSRGMEWDDDGDFDEGDWWTCEVKDQTFQATCGPDCLEYCLKMFLDWAEGESAT